MNPIVERIAKENLSIKKHYGHSGEFAYYPGKKLITHPAFEDLNCPRNMFSMAHELGHHYQYVRYGYFLNLLGSLSRMKSVVQIIFFPFLLWEEIDAWFKAWIICKEENLSREGFLNVAIHSLMSYVSSFLIQLFNIGKYIFGLYVACVFAVKFSVISMEMNLGQPELIKTLRDTLLSSSKPQNAIVSDLFSSVLTSYLVLLICYLMLRILFISSKLSKYDFGSKNKKL